MKKVIGFAYEYYTLWHVQVSNCYMKDAYGCAHQTHQKMTYTYVKNISKSLDAAKREYPEAEVDLELKGYQRHFVRYTPPVNPDGYFVFGKYAGHLIEKVMKTDYQYCIWYMQKFGHADVVKHIINHPLYLQELANKQAEKEAVLASAALLVDGMVVEVEFTTNGWNEDSEGACLVSAKYGDVSLFIKAPASKAVGGMYPYIMPVLGGKAMRTKGKRMNVLVEKVLETQVLKTGIVRQVITTV